MSLTIMVHFILMLLGVGIIAGLLYWLIGSAPFIPDPFKKGLQWVVLALCVVLLIYMIIGLIGGGTSTPLFTR